MSKPPKKPQYMKHLSIVTTPNTAWKPPKHVAGKATQKTIVREFYDYFRSIPDESVIAVALNPGWEVIGYTELSRGSKNRTSCSVGSVVRFALLANAVTVVIMHNHPGCNSDVAPSEADDIFTANIERALALMEVSLLDHMIVGERKVYSYRQAGRLN